MIVYALVSVGKNVLAEYTATFGKFLFYDMACILEKADRRAQCTNHDSARCIHICLDARLDTMYNNSSNQLPATHLTSNRKLPHSNARVVSKNSLPRWSNDLSIR